MARHAERELVLAHEHCSGIFASKQRRLFVAMRAYDCFDTRVEARAISIIRRTANVSGVAITSMRARAICA